MNEPRLELAEVFRGEERRFLEVFGRTLSAEQRRAFRAISVCRTAALGGHVQQCDRCGHRRVAYNSCRNRHCPKCQAAARATWLDARAAELLPVPYFHIVFTLPAVLGPVALQNPRGVYGILFRAASETLLELADDPKHLGARIGLLAVLHTWGQTLVHHPHIHCVVPGGGISHDGSRWVGCDKDFFLPVRVLSRVFRGKFVDLLKRAYRGGKLAFHGKLLPLSRPPMFERLLNTSVKHDWVVYAKRPFGGPRQVLKYLACYTHRVAISNRRLVRLADGKVTFRYKDYAQGGRQRTMTLDAVHFTRRFLLHVLPSGMVRIRYYGFLSHRCRGRQLRLAQRLLGCGGGDQGGTSPPVPESDREPPDEDHSFRCPCCGVGQMRVIEKLHPQHASSHCYRRRGRVHLPRMPPGPRR